MKVRKRGIGGYAEELGETNNSKLTRGRSS